MTELSVFEFRILAEAATMKNPVLGNLHDFQAAQIAKLLPALRGSNGQSALSLWKYYERRPHKFFSEFAMNVFLRELERLQEERYTDLKELIAAEITGIDNALRHLEEVNGFDWHDESVKKADDYRKLMLIEQNLNPAYLRLTEAVLKPLMMIPAYFSRINRGKKTEKLELFDISAELKSTDFAALFEPYKPTVRNGIGHGGVTYGANSISYRDKKGNSVDIRVDDIIQIFDDLLDVCNGLVAAISYFLLLQSDIDYPRPPRLQLEELRVEAETSYWKVIGWLPSSQVNGSQLIIYIEVTALDYQKVLFSSIQTAILAERLFPGFDRYFLSLSQPSGALGFGAFHGNKLQDHRLLGHEIDQYTDVIDSPGIFFIPRRKIPKFFGKLGTFWLALCVQKPLVKAQYQNHRGLFDVDVRHTEMHRNGWRSVVNADVVLDGIDFQLNQASVRRQSSAIIRKAVRSAKSRQGYFSILRYLPMGYVRVKVFRKDFRRRKFDNFGLAEDLVGTLQVNRIKRIRVPDISGATIERYREIRIAWNRRWIETLDGVNVSKS